MGKLGWTPYEYYTSLPLEFYAAAEGYLERQTESAKLLRFASFRVAEAMAGSKVVGNLERFWPMEKQDKPEPKKITKAEYDAIMQKHNVKLKTNG